MSKKRRCVVCKKLTENWQSTNGSAYHCFDGCYSTTGIDNRTRNGKPFQQGEWLFNNKFPAAYPEYRSERDLVPNVEDIFKLFPKR